MGERHRVERLLELSKNPAVRILCEEVLALRKRVTILESLLPANLCKRCEYNPVKTAGRVCQLCYDDLMVDAEQKAVAVLTEPEGWSRGDFCCQRSAGGLCHDHDPNTYMEGAKLDE